MPFAATWMDLQIIQLPEINRNGKENLKEYVHIYIYN